MKILCQLGTCKHSDFSVETLVTQTVIDADTITSIMDDLATGVEDYAHGSIQV